MYFNWVYSRDFRNNDTDIHVCYVLMHLRRLKVSKFGWLDAEDLVLQASIALPKNAANYYRNVLHIMTRNDA